jgi:hypothetical protein
MSRKPTPAAMITSGRNTMRPEAMITTLKTLKLHGMARPLPSWPDNPHPLTSRPSLFWRRC